MSYEEKCTEVFYGNGDVNTMLMSDDWKLRCEGIYLADDIDTITLTKLLNDCSEVRRALAVSGYVNHLLLDDPDPTVSKLARQAAQTAGEVKLAKAIGII